MSGRVRFRECVYVSLLFASDSSSLSQGEKRTQYFPTNNNKCVEFNMATQAPEAASKRRPRALNYSDFSALFKSPQNAKYRKALAAFAKKTAATAATAAAAAAAIRSTEGGVSAIDTASAPASAAEGAAGAPAAVDHQAIRQFISSFTTGLRQTAAWKEQDEREWQNTKEGVEKYAMLKLHSTVFLADAKCREVDERLVTKARHLATFLDFEHLDIDSEAEELVDAWSNASNALQRINHYKAPRDKMVCILNCCQVRAQSCVICQPTNRPVFPGLCALIPWKCWLAMPRKGDQWDY